MSSGAILIQVHPAGGGDVPVEGEWIISRPEPVAGETVLISLVLQTPNSPELPDQVQFSPPDWGDFQEVSGVGEITSTRYSTGILYSVPVLTYAATPTSSGEFTVPAATARVGSATVQVPAQSFTVRGAPSQIGESGAVGEFQYMLQVSPRQVFQGEVVEVQIRIEGQGNLPYLQLPSPRAENLLLTGSQETERVQPTQNGFMGTRTVTHRLSTRDVGRFQVDVPGFAWYSPEQGRVVSRAAESLSVEVLPVPLGSGDSRSARLGLMAQEKARQMHDIRSVPLSRVLVWLLPAAVALILRKLVSGRAGRAVFLGIASMTLLVSAPLPYADVDLSAGEQHFFAGEYAESRQFYVDVLQEHDYLAGVWYNAGLAAFRGGEPVQAVYLLREAVSRRPDEPVIREALGWVEAGLELIAQVPPPSAVSPPLLIAGAVVLLNLMGMLWLFYRVRRKGGVAVVFLTMGLLLLVTLGGALRGLRDADRPIGVLQQDAAGVSVYRIPVDGVDHWMQLPSGTAVRLLDISGGYYLVETGPGVQGWVLQDVILGL